MNANNNNKKKYSLAAIFRNGTMTRQIPLILLIAGWLILMVLNRYQVEGLLRKKTQVEKELDFLKEEQVQMQKEYQQSVRISRIAEELDSVGVKFISGPPYEIEK